MTEKFAALKKVSPLMVKFWVGKDGKYKDPDAVVLSVINRALSSPTNEQINRFTELEQKVFSGQALSLEESKDLSDLEKEVQPKEFYRTETIRNPDGQIQLIPDETYLVDFIEEKIRAINEEYLEHNEDFENSDWAYNPENIEGLTIRFVYTENVNPLDKLINE